MIFFFFFFVLLGLFERNFFFSFRSGIIYYWCRLLPRKDNNYFCNNLKRNKRSKHNSNKKNSKTKICQRPRQQKMFVFVCFCKFHAMLFVCRVNKFLLNLFPTCCLRWIAVLLRFLGFTVLLHKKNQKIKKIKHNKYKKIKILGKMLSCLLALVAVFVASIKGDVTINVVEMTRPTKVVATTSGSIHG